MSDSQGHGAMAAASTATAQKTEVSLLRLYVLRAAYLLLVVGLGVYQWPGLVQRSGSWDLWHTVGASLLGAICVLAVLGIRYPLKLLPLLLFELAWKSIWLIAIALPRWSSHQMTAAFQGTVSDCLMGIVIFPLVIPWGYAWREFVKARAERWR